MKLISWIRKEKTDKINNDTIDKKKSNTEKQIKSNNIYLYLFILIITLLITSVYFLDHYATDSYKMVDQGLQTYKDLKISEGRVVLYFIFSFIELIFGSVFNLNNYLFVYRIFLFMSDMIISFGILLVYNKIINIKNYTNIKQKILVFVSVLTMFLSIALTENLLFIDNLGMIIGLLLSIISSIIYVSSIKNKSFILLIILIIGTFCYQGIINFFVPLTILFIIIKDNKRIKIIELIKIMTIYLLPLCFNYIYVKVIGSESRVNNIDIEVSTLYVFYNILKYYLKYLLIPLIAILLYFIYSKIKFKTFSVNSLYVVILSIISCTLLTFGTRSILSLRMCFSIYAIIGIVEILLITNIIFTKKTFYIFLTVTLVILTYNINSSIEFQKINVQSTKINAEILQKITNKISDYEKDSTNIVTKVIFYSDKKVDFEVWGKEASASNYPTYYVNWSRVAILNIYLNKKLTELKADNNSEIYNYFINNDWNKFDEEQIVINGDTVHICAF